MIGFNIRFYKIFLTSAFALLFTSVGYCQNSLTAAVNKGVRLNASSSLVVIDTDTGKSVYSKRAGASVKPASVLKILTSKVALDTLGPEHKFRTQFYGRGFKGSKISELYIKGYGDPSFVHEHLWIAARKIYLRGVREVTNLYVDDTAFIGAKEREGQKAYMAASSATSLNFNIVTFEACPTTAGKPAKVLSDPYEFPIKRQGKIMTVGRGSNKYGIDELPGNNSTFSSFRLVGTMRAGQACDEVYRTVSDPAIYMATVFKEFLKRLGISVLSQPQRKRTPTGAGRIYTYWSKDLALIVRDLNHYSSNFIAEQLLMTLGAVSKTEYRRKIGIKALEAELARIGEKPSDYSIHDASGLSHDNRITARALARLLLDLKKNETYGPEFVNSLAIDSRSGTLRKRNLDGVVRAKTGTINGVGTLAGYLRSKKGKNYAFVLLQNKVPYRAAASAVEKKLVRILYNS